ncbi:hypothetical protein PAMA_006338 [Pampus argenteus]
MWRAVERGSTAHTGCCCLKHEKNEGSRTSEGMIENSDLPSAVLTVASVMSLTLLFLLCLRCKRKSTATDESDYENIEDGKFAYVIPTHQSPPVYGNIEPLPNIEESCSREDEEDYENSDFLQIVKEEEDDEPDYENT